VTRVHSPGKCPKPLPPHTRVGRRDGVVGRVQNYRADTAQAQLGMFPVRWADQFWEICGADDVAVVVEAPKQIGAA
jgi:hypothetical protein